MKNCVATYLVMSQFFIVPDESRCCAHHCDPTAVFRIILPVINLFSSSLIAYVILVGYTPHNLIFLMGMLNRSHCMQYFLFVFFVTFLTTIFAIWCLRPLAVRIGLVDIPNDRKNHIGHIPLIGGIGILFGFVIGLLMLKISLMPYRILLAASVFIAFFGVLDDFHELSHRQKFWVQIFVASLIVTLGHKQISVLGNLFGLGDVQLKALTIPFSILAVIVIINAMNMLDGLDGLMGSIALVQFIFFAIIASCLGSHSDFAIIFVLLSSVIAFLCFNFPLFRRRALVFMGDTGSMLIGLLLSWFFLSLSDTSHTLSRPITFLWIMAFPLFDMINVVYRRIRAGKSPFHADREHFHHMFQNTGLRDMTIVLILLAISFTFGAIGLVLSIYQVSDFYMVILFILSLIIYLLFLNYASYLFKWVVKGEKP